jgi:hypothetical protein
MCYISPAYNRLYPGTVADSMNVSNGLLGRHSHRNGSGININNVGGWRDGVGSD